MLGTSSFPFPRALLLIAASILYSCPGSWGEETITLTVDRDVVCVGEAITGSASLNYYGGGNRPSVTIAPVLPQNQVPDRPVDEAFQFPDLRLDDARRLHHHRHRLGCVSRDQDGEGAQA